MRSDIVIGMCAGVSAAIGIVALTFDWPLLGLALVVAGLVLLITALFIEELY